MVLGRELIADVEDIENDLLLETIDGIEPLMEKIIEICKLKVVAKCKYQFTPIGVTMLYLSSESHLTIHTYPEKKASSINIYYIQDALNVIYNYFNQSWIIKKVINRLNVYKYKERMTVYIHALKKFN